MITSLTRSLVSNKSWYRSMLAGNDPFIPSDYELISTTVLGSSQASITFDVSTYASTYKHLQIRAVAQGAGGSNDNADMFFNNDTGTNYSWHSLYGTGSGSPGTDTSVNRSGIPECPPLLASSYGFFTVAIIDILDAFSTTKYKTVRHRTGRAGDTVNYVSLDSGNWRSTSAITSIKIQGRSFNINTGSRFSIYGLKG